MTDGKDSGSYAKISKYDAFNVTNKSTCTLSNFSGSSSNSYNGISVINSTTLMFIGSTITGGGCYLFDITNLEANNCTQIDSNISGNSPCRLPASNYRGQPDSDKDGFTFWPVNDKQWNYSLELKGTGFLVGTDATYSTIDSMIIPNKSDNTTYYLYSLFGPNANATKKGSEMGIFKNVAGTLTPLDSPYNYWGLEINDTPLAMWKYNASTTLGFLIAANRFYVVNFTRAEAEQNVSIIWTMDPQNETIFLNESHNLRADLWAADNGTISWYLDGIMLGNLSITNAPETTSFKPYYFPTGIMADGGHWWQANYTDTNGNVWYSTKQYFTFEATSAISTVAQNLASAFGVSLDWGKGLLALLISATIAGALAYWVKYQLFIPGLVACIFFFAMAGFFPAWFTLVFIVIAGILFAKFTKLI